MEQPEVIELEDSAPHSCNDSTKMGTELDTKTGFCFLCLKDPSSDNVKNKNENVIRETRLQNICRHLNHNPCSIFLNSLRESFVSEDEDDATYLRDKYDFSVMFCLNCSSLTNKLFKMLNETDVAKLLMDHQLQEFYTCLMAPPDPELEHFIRWCKFEDKMISNCLNPMEASLLERIKLKTKERCSIKVKQLMIQSLPQVLLCRMETRQTNIPEDAPSPAGSTDDDIDIIEEIISSIIPDDDIDELTPPDQNDDLHPVATVDLTDCDTPAIVTPSKTRRPTGKQKCYEKSKTFVSEVLVKCCNVTNSDESTNQQSYECAICENYDKARSRSGMLSHLTNVHPETFFAPKKFETLTEEAFKSCCREVLSTDTGKRKKLKMVGSSTREREELLCSICGSTCEDSRKLRCHMVLEHHKELGEKLTSLQQRRVWLSGTFVRKAYQRDTELDLLHKNKTERRRHKSGSSIPGDNNVSSVELIDLREEDAEPTAKDKPAAPVASGPNKSGAQSSSSSSSKVRPEGNPILNPSDDQTPANPPSPQPSTSTSAQARGNLENGNPTPEESDEEGYTRCAFCGAVYEKSVYQQHLLKRHQNSIFTVPLPTNLTDTSIQSWIVSNKKIADALSPKTIRKLIESISEVRDLRNENVKLWKCKRSEGGCGLPFASRSLYKKHKRGQCPNQRHTQF